MVETSKIGQGRPDAGFARYFNSERPKSRRGSRSHVWQVRFCSCPLYRPRLWRANAYVEWNPRRAGLIAAPWSYPWSSAAAHWSLNQAAPLAGSWVAYEDEYGFRRRREVLLSSVGEETRRDWPPGSEAFGREQLGAATSPRPIP